MNSPPLLLLKSHSNVTAEGVFWLYGRLARLSPHRFGKVYAVEVSDGDACGFDGFADGREVCSVAEFRNERFAAGSLQHDLVLPPGSDRSDGSSRRRVCEFVEKGRVFVDWRSVEWISRRAGHDPDVGEGLNHDLALCDGAIQGVRDLFASRHGHVPPDERLQVFEDACGVVRLDERVVEFSVVFEDKADERGVNIVLIRAGKPSLGRRERHFGVCERRKRQKDGNGCEKKSFHDGMAV